MGLLWIALCLVDLAFVQRRITAATATRSNIDELNRTDRSELLGTWALLGICTLVAIPLLRLLLLLWGVHALTLAHPGPIDVLRRSPETTSYGGCAPAMGDFMSIYVLVGAGVMCIVVVLLLALGLLLAVRTCCPPPQKRYVPEPAEDERRGLVSGGNAESKDA
jgi:hypothetical protein